MRDVLEYYAAAPERQSGRQIPVPGGIDVTFYEPLGVVGRDRALELPHGHRRLGLRAGPGRRQHRRAQAGRADAARARCASASWRSRRGCPRACCRSCPGKGSVVGRALRRPPRRAQGVLHRLDRGGARRHGGLRPADQAGHARARRQERQHRLRRRRPRAGGGPRPLRRVRQRGPGLLRPLAHPRRALGLRALHGAARAGRTGRGGGGPHARDDRDGPAHLARTTWPRWPPSCPRAPRWPCGARAPTARATGSPRPCWRRSTRATVPRSRRSSARWSSSSPSRTRPTPCAWPTTRPTGCPARSGRATSGGRCGWPAPSRRGRCRSTRTRRCATGRPSAA